MWLLLCMCGWMRACVCVCAYVWYESFNIRTYALAQLPMHLTGITKYNRNKTNHARTYICFACVLVIVIVTISFTHSRAFYSNTKTLVQCTVFHFIHWWTLLNAQRYCRYGRTHHNSYSLLLRVLVSVYALCRCRRSAINGSGYGAFDVFCFVYVFRVLFGVVSFKSIIRCSFSSKRMLKQRWCECYLLRDIFSDRFLLRNFQCIRTW